MSAAVEKLERLADLSPDQAREVEAIWPLTLRALRAGAVDEVMVLDRPLGSMRRLLELELDERLHAQTEVAPA